MAAVELAIVGSLLFMLLIGVLNYGLLFLRAQQITQAARAGARAAVLPDATNAKVDAVIAPYMEQAGIDTYTVTRVPSDVEAADSGDPVKIEITVNTSELALISTSIAPVPPEITAAATMAKEGT